MENNALHAGAWQIFFGLHIFKKNNSRFGIVKPAITHHQPHIPIFNVRSYDDYFAFR